MKAQMFNYRFWLNGCSDITIKRMVENMLLKSGFTILSYVEYNFNPVGFTSLWLLAESHCAIHTFPEENKTYIELSSCNELMQIQFKNECSILNVFH